MIESFFDRRVSIQRAPDATPSDSGAAQRVYADVYTNVPCVIYGKSGSFRQQGYGLEKATSHGAGFATGTDIRVGDRVIDGSSTYEATFVALRRTSHVEVDLILVTLQ